MNEHEDNILPEEENMPPLYSSEQPPPSMEEPPPPKKVEVMAQISPQPLHAPAIEATEGRHPLEQGEGEKFLLEIIKYKDTPLRSFLHGLTGNQEDTKDLMQEFYIQIFLNARYFQQKKDQIGLGLFFKCLKNLFLNTQRSNNRRVKRNQYFHENGGTQDILPDTNLTHLEIEEIKKIAKLLLKKDDFKLLELKLEDATTEEIMQACGLSKGNVGVRWNRIRKKLRDCWEKRF